MDSQLNSVLSSCTNTTNSTSTATAGTNTTTSSSKLITNPSTSTTPLTPSTNGAARMFINFTEATTSSSAIPTSRLLSALTNDVTIIPSSSTMVPDFRACNPSFSNDITRSPRMPSLSCSLASNESAVRVIPSPVTPIAGNVHAGFYTQKQSRSADVENIFQEIPIETLKKKFEVTQSSMDIYQQKYPVLSQMLKIYLNFMKIRFDHYKRNDDVPTVKETFNFNDCIRMNHFDADHVITMFNELPYFCDLPDTEKSALIHRFRDPFLMFERIYDTLNTVGSTLDDKCIVLQNGDCFMLETLKRSSVPSNLTNVFNIIFSSWEKLMPMVRKIDPDIVEAAYLFSCFLLSSTYLKTPISNEGEEMIRRGRLIIHQEMREYYQYDDVKWGRICELRKIMLVTEKFVAQYEERARMDRI